MSLLPEIVARNRAGEAVALPSWCTAHPGTLSAILRRYREDAAPILIEATCNQVNQDGGYTGLRPADFRAFVEGLAKGEDVDPSRLIFGGDHLGPNPWKKLPAQQAMDKARVMVAAYVEAGFTKIHLDASMACADDGRLAEEVMAERAADLAVMAENAAGGRALSYVIGTEVPVPGGETEKLDVLAVTAPEAARNTVEMHRAAFAARGLSAAMDRVIGVVVQPGVDFGNDQIFGYDPARARELTSAATKLGGPLFEAHSTDYQTAEALRGLVEGHFAILKVGPELTFAWRQALFTLDRICSELGQETGLVPAILDTMRAEPGDWRAYVEAGPREQDMMLYGLSDRVRYYWPRPKIRVAVERLMETILSIRPEPGLVAQATGGLAGPVNPNTLAREVIDRMVGAVVDRYRTACGD